MGNLTISAETASLDEILCTQELRSRRSRLPDYQKENRALVALARALSENPRKILQTLADTILEVTGAGSAGISLLTPADGEENFCWAAIAGRWSAYVGGCTPRNFGPCGDVLDRNATLLFRHPERRYTYLQPLNPPAEEELLVPFYVEGKVVGTIWAMSHDPLLKFDAEDERLLTSLATFASSAFQVASAIETNDLARLQSVTFDTTLSTITDFAYIFDRDGRFRYINRPLLDLWGLKLEEAVGKNFFDLKYPDDLAQRLQRQIQQVIETREGLKDETPYTSPTGAGGYYEYIFQPVFDAGGNVESVAGSTRDISTRKKMEEDLHDAKARLESTLLASEIATWTFDIQKDLVVADENLARLHGVSERDAAGAPLRQYLSAVHPEDRDEVEAAVREAIDKPGKHFEKDYRLIQADGSIRWVSGRGRVEHDKDGKPLRFPGVLIDVTERKRAEEKFRKLAETLEAQVHARTEELQSRAAEMLHQAGQLRDLSNRLQHSQDAERRRIARELHDSAGQTIVALSLNLGLISGTSDAASISQKLDESKQLVRDLSDEIRTLSYLLHPPLLDEGGLAGALDWYAAGFQDRSGLKVQLDISPALGRFSGETELAIFRIVQECLTNIHRHSGATEASVALARTGNNVSLKIQDNGKGMSPEKLNAIRQQRSGVGITGMRERVRHLEGSMEIDSDERGTGVAVTLPAAGQE